jgi:hypothetical protein
MRIIAPVLATVALLAGSACGGGQSEADKAKEQACNAVSDIQTQVATIKALPLSTSSVDKAKTAISTIDDDLHTISDAVPKVKGDLKQQLQTANDTFTTQVTETLQSITSAQSLTAAATALTAAGTTLQSSYEQAFADVKC